MHELQWQDKVSNLSALSSIRNGLSYILWLLFRFLPLPLPLSPSDGTGKANGTAKKGKGRPYLFSSRVPSALLKPSVVPPFQAGTSSRWGWMWQSPGEKRNIKRSPSRYAQRAGTARKLLQCVLIRATWLHLCFGIILTQKSRLVRNHRFCHAGKGYCRRFTHFRRKFNSVYICFIRIRIRIDRRHCYRWKIRYNSFASAQSLQRYLAWPHLETFLQEKTTIFCFRPQKTLCVS